MYFLHNDRLHCLSTQMDSDLYVHLHQDLHIPLCLLPINFSFNLYLVHCRIRL